MAHFAKTIELNEEEQVLVEYEYNADNEKHEVKISTEINDVKMRATVGMNKESQARKFMAEYTAENAQKFIDNVKEMMS